MEIFTAEFLSALLAIIMVNLVLSGDNAIVIALAARKLPDQVRSKAVVWGTVGAVAVRVVMTLVVVWLLEIPGLRFLGGLALVWIAYKLLAEDGGDEHSVEASSSFFGAMKTIIIADAVMGLDNVLAVAGAAKGDMTLIIVGLILSVPIVIWGSQMIMKAVERFPIIVYIGSGVLAWTAAAMMVHEPLVHAQIEAYTGLSIAIHIVTLVGVLGVGFMKSTAPARARVAMKVIESTRQKTASLNLVRNNKGERTMVKVLIPVDGSANSLLAVRQVINDFIANSAMEVHLLHVRTPFPMHIAQFLSKKDRASFHRDTANAAMQSSRELLNQHGVPHATHIEVGDKPTLINKVAQRLHADLIVMGISRKNSLTRLLEDSLTNRVLEVAQVPVEIVAGSEVSALEKYGLPAGLAAIVALLATALIVAD